MTRENYINEQDKKDGDSIIKEAEIIAIRARFAIAEEFDKSHEFIKLTNKSSIDNETYSALVYLSFKTQLTATLLENEIDTALKMDEYISLDDLKSNIKKLWKDATGEEF